METAAQPRAPPPERPAPWRAATVARATALNRGKQTRDSVTGGATGALRLQGKRLPGRAGELVMGEVGKREEEGEEEGKEGEGVS